MSDREVSPRPRGGSMERRDRERDTNGDERRRRISRSPVRRRTRSPTRSRSRERRRRRTRSRSKSPSRGRERVVERRNRSRSPMSSRKRHMGDRDLPDPSRVLGVFGLSLYTTERDLHNVFHKFGGIERVTVVLDAQTGRSRGFAFVYFESYEDAKAAKEECSGMEMDGRKIRVDFSITQRAHTPTPGIYMGRPNAKRTTRNRYGYDRDRVERRSRSPYGKRRDGGGHYERHDRHERSRSRSYTPPSRKYRRGYY
ncbi:unnamed protein product [Notodromas monacha]|uniref:RRM domain-containing protein n=1 Tax=Notodromas monacha TaxID=399045 RepID=A0A7R9GD09_9CRUS|nr:unnamed protein product [Notodromas monacha]CAG0916666.1 unnamed protein product [Notodromas monacha]